MALSQLPVSMMEATLFSGIVYFMVGFHMDWAYFLIFWGVVASSNLCLSSLFRWDALIDLREGFGLGWNAPPDPLANKIWGLGLSS
jgi:hypothetical protein